MRKGYVAMDKDWFYWWYRNKPKKMKFHCNAEIISENDICFLNKLFSIEPVEDWTQSLIEVGQ